MQDADFLSMYTRSNGLKLFFSSSDNTDDKVYFIPPVTIFPIEKIALKTAQFREELEDIPPEDMPKYADGVVFGEAAGTGNFFAVMPNGPFEGQIFYCDHDPDENDWPNRPFAISLKDFLRRVVEPPFTVISDICGADRAWV